MSSRSGPPGTTERGASLPPRGARTGGGRDWVSAIGLVAILMLIAGAITAILADYQKVGLVTWVVLLFVSGCFAAAYLLLRSLVMPRLEKRGSPWWAKLCVHASVVLAAVGIGGEIASQSLALIGGDPASRTRRNLLPVGLAITVAMVVVEAGYLRLRRRARQHELREERLRRQALKAELAAIQARTDPHFLFNSLNTVAGFVEEDPARAADMLQRLAALFRYALEGSRVERVRLGDEVQAVRTYLEIEAVRFGDRLRWSMTVEESLLDLPVLPHLLQPVVENAVRHGIGPRPGPGKVEVRISQEGDRLRLEVEDDGARREGPARQGSGTALADLKERLQLSYGGGASLQRDTGPLGGCRVRIIVPTGPVESR